MSLPSPDAGAAPDLRGTLGAHRREAGGPGRLLPLAASALSAWLVLAGPARGAAPGGGASEGASPPVEPSGAVVRALKQADKAFEFQEFDRVIALLSPLAETPERVPDVDQRVRVLERLGAAYWFVGTSGKAQLWFSRLLKLRPDHALDKLVYPPSLIAFFDEQRERLRQLGFIGPKPGGGGKARPRDKPATVLRVREITRQDVSWATYLVPFGYGQFVNGDDAAGSVLLGLQVLGLVGNVATYFGVRALQGGHGQVAPGDRGQVSLLQGLWIGSTAVLGAAYATSVIDGYLRRPPAETVREFDLPRDGGPAPSTPPPGLTLGVAPSLRGVGLALDGRF